VGGVVRCGAVFGTVGWGRGRGPLRPAVEHGHAEDDRVGILFGDLDVDVEIAAFVERACVDQLELGVAGATAAVLEQSSRR